MKNFASIDTYINLPQLISEMYKLKQQQQTALSSVQPKAASRNDPFLPVEEE